MMNPISGWLCTNNSQNLFVKMVHPDGRVELHDRPIRAAELLNLNPKCCVAYPTVFQQPYAVVSPSTTLALGKKYYIVPISTARKLQQAKMKPNDRKMKIEKKDGEMESFRWLMRKNKNGKKVKRGKNLGLEEKTGFSKKRANEYFSHTCSGHWQPGLESITEE